VGKPEVGSSRDWRGPSFRRTTGRGGSRSCQPSPPPPWYVRKPDTPQAVPSLHRDRNWKNLLLYGDRDQLGLVVNVEFAHQVELVRFHRLDADSQDRRRFLYGIALAATSSPRVRAESGRFSAAAPASLVPRARVVFQSGLNCGLNDRSPRCTSRSERNKSGRGSVLEQVTLAPERRACCTYSRSSCMVRYTMRVPVQCSSMRRPASNDDIPGMVISSSTRSGRCSRTNLSASAASPASPTTAKSGVSSSSGARHSAASRDRRRSRSEWAQPLPDQMVQPCWST